MKRYESSSIGMSRRPTGSLGLIAILGLLAGWPTLAAGDRQPGAAEVLP